jgi:hypothetical protein
MAQKSSARAPKTSGPDTVNTVERSGCAAHWDFWASLWKACGIGNHFQNSSWQRPADRSDRESKLGFKWLSINQLCNSRGINISGG